MILLFICGVIGLLPAVIAASKGRNFFLWWLYGAALFIIALPHSLFTGSNKTALEQQRHAKEPNIKCPSCAELIKADAKVCRYCQRDVQPQAALTSA